MTRVGPLFVSVVVLCTGLTGACSSAAPEVVESDTVVPVVVQPAALGDIRAVVRVTGMVTAAPGAELVVVAPESARIAELPHGEGDRVAMGDLLVRFDIPSVAAEVARQRAEIERAQAQILNAGAAQARAKDLFDRGVAARKEVEDADRDVADGRATLAQAQAALGAAESVAARAIVRAPFVGVVTKRLHNPGDVVEAAASDPILRLVDPLRLEVTAYLQVADVARIVLGTRARLTGWADVALIVASRATAVDQATGSVPIRLTFAGRRPALAIGTPLQVEVDAEARTGVVLIPSTAVVREGEETAVLVAANGKAERRPVVIGLSDALRTEVRSGLESGESVITRGQAGLPDGATISIEAARP